jgi:hypothetical protein
MDGGVMHHYLSFADQSLFLGACVVESPDFIGAVLRTHELGINPGGQVLGFALPEDLRANDPGAYDWLMQNLDRLISREEFEANGGGMRLGDMTPEEKEALLYEGDVAVAPQWMEE